MAYELPKLDYGYDALQPHIDAKTMEIHHTKHHQAYIDKANAVLKGTAWENKTVEDVLRSINDLPSEIKGVVQNHGGGHANHSLFWKIIGPDCGGEPTGNVANAIENELGGFTKFKETFSNSAVTRFGSGWAWLCVDNGKLCVESTANQDSPLMQGKTPVLGLDVWEHAYYLNYQNRRPDYISAFFNIVNWTEVERRYNEAC
jgi:superoxide dismutase, Fe-Mn family